MFNPTQSLRDNPALFACYILYVYFRGRNAVRIEREMRALGYATFHRRNLYPRGKQPGWIAKYWSADTLVRMSVASTRKESSDDPDSLAASGDADKSVRTPTDFHSWLKAVAPKMTWDWKHQQVIIKQLEKVTSGECKRLMIFLPPRHGKTELVSVKYTAWRMQQNPAMNVILGSYNQRLADRMSRKIRTTLCDAEALRLGKGENTSSSECQELKPQINADQRRSATSAGEKDIGVHPRPSAVTSFDQVSPFPFSRPRAKNSVSEWETAMGGSFRAVGSGSGVTGFGAHLIVIDDPVKNRAQAESETFRNRVWDWYKDDLYTRLEPDGSIVLIQTRWHEDDLAGRLLSENLDDWTVINLPALAEEASAVESGQWKMDSEETDTATRPSMPIQPAVSAGCTQPIETKRIPPDSTDPSQEGRFTPAPIMENGQRTMDNESDPQSDLGQMDKGSETIRSPLSITRSPEIVHSPLSTVHCFEWRRPGEALCPERFDEEALAERKRLLGTYAFSALFQQRPTPAGGEVFKREWFKNVIDFAPPGLRWCRGYDLAVSTKTGSDYTASFRVAFDKQNNLYISGGFRRRIEFPEQRRYIIDRIANERDTEHGVELALHGQALIQDLRRDPALRGKSLRGVKVSSDKLTRALTWAPVAEDGKVFLVRTSIDNGRRTVDNAGRSSPRSAADLSQEGGLTLAASRGKSGGNPTFPTETGCVDTEISPRIRRWNNSEIVHSPLSVVSWIDDLLDELAAFPNGTHDDQIDAISIAVQMHSVKPRTGGGFLIT